MFSALRLSKNVVPEVYDLAWNVFGNGRADGSARIHVHLTRAQKDPIVLHADPSITLNRVLCNDREVKVVRNEDRLEIHSTKGFSNGKHTLEFLFQVSVRHDALGLYASVHSKVVCFSTQMQPVYARMVFPCFDEPAFKAIFRIRVKWHPLAADEHLPWVILSNMPSKPRQDSLGFTQFYDTPRMSTYLVCFVIAPLVTSGTAGLVRAWQFWDEERAAECVAVEKFLKAVLKLLGKMLGATYHLPKLDVVPVADFHGGAMENWGLVTVHDTHMYPHLDDPLGSVSTWELLAHECVHMWFGNLITAEWWIDLWIQEGFATFLATYAISILGIQGDYQEIAWPDFLKSYVSECMLLDDLPSTRAVIPTSVSTNLEIADMFDGITYAKAALTIRSMFLLLGSDGFFQGLQSFLHSFAFQSVSTRDLFDHFHPTVKEFMLPWLLLPGFPILEANLNKGRFETCIWPILVSPEIGEVEISDVLPDGFPLQSYPCLAALMPKEALLLPARETACTMVGKVMCVAKAVERGVLLLTAELNKHMQSEVEYFVHALLAWNAYIKSWCQFADDPQEAYRSLTGKHVSAASTLSPKAQQLKFKELQDFGFAKDSDYSLIGSWGVPEQLNWALLNVPASRFHMLFKKRATKQSKRDQWIQTNAQQIVEKCGLYSAIKTFSTAMKKSNSSSGWETVVEVVHRSSSVVSAYEALKKMEVVKVLLQPQLSALLPP